jgi:diguanylate cyclase (GGDEF)-like protein
VTAPDLGVAAQPLFERACRDVLAYLSEQVPLAMWAVTRVENDRQTYLALEDAAYGLAPAGSHPWNASFCIHMATGQGPRVAPDAQAVPLYAAAGVNELIPIGAYAGAAIDDADGSLFGAICGLDPQVQGADLSAVEPLLVLLSRLLTVALTADRQAQRLARTALEERLRADVDALTDVYSRGAWDRLLTEEASLFSVTADPTAIVVIDLDGLKQTNDVEGHGAGDALLVRAARAISSAVRTHDPVARLGGDEFAVLLRECTEVAASDREADIRQALADAGVAASLGVACARPGVGLREAQHAADTAMYADKRSHRQAEGETP